MRGLGRAWQSTMMSMLSPTASRIAATQARRTGPAADLQRHRRGTAIVLKAVKPLSTRAREFGEALRVVALVEILHLPAAEMAVEADVVANASAPELVAGHAVNLAENVPERDVDSADGGAADDAVAVPEVLAKHHLPEVLDARGILADEQLGDVLDRADDGAGVPFERRFAPAVKARLVGDDFDENPVPHPRVADECLDGGDLHLTPWSSATLSSTTRSTSPRSTFEFVIP